jgi:hypothetical protein
MPQILLYHSTTAAAVPPGPLGIGEMAVVVAPLGYTKIWLGDGATNPGRVILSTDPTDGPIMTGDYLLLTGGTMTGAIQLPAAMPTVPTQAAHKDYVDQAIAALQRYRGTYQIAANTPPLTAAGNTNGDNYICITAAGTPGSQEAAVAGIPGIATGTMINYGDRVIWAGAPTNAWQIIRAGTLDVTTADARYVNITGDTMTGMLTLPATLPTLPAHATNKAYVDSLIVPFTVVTDGVSIVGDGAATGTPPGTGPLAVELVDCGTF